MTHVILGFAIAAVAGLSLTLILLIFKAIPEEKKTKKVKRVPE